MNHWFVNRFTGTYPWKLLPMNFLNETTVYNKIDAKEEFQSCIELGIRKYDLIAIYLWKLEQTWNLIEMKKWQQCNVKKWNKYIFLN